MSVLIDKSKKQIVVYANNILTMTYQNIGKMIKENIIIEDRAEYEKQEFEEEPIAIILCSGKDEEIVELMDLNKDNIHISEYWLKLPSKELLKEKLQRAILFAKERIEN